MTSLIQQLTQTAEETNFSGVLSFNDNGQVYEQAYGYRDRANQLPNKTDTRFAIASGTKGFTALAIAKLIERGQLTFSDSALEILNQNLPWLPREVTIDHLLTHTSGIGDHLDEDLDFEIRDFYLETNVRLLLKPSDYFPLIAKAQSKHQPGEKFTYSNSGYVTLSAIVEKVSGTPFPEFAQTHIFNPAGMTKSGFFKSDALPANTALGYLFHKHSLRTNIFNLPIIGSGDGGAYTTKEDVSKFWTSLLSGKIIDESLLTHIHNPSSERTSDSDFVYGRGFWLTKDDHYPTLEGYDAGVSFRTSTTPDQTFTYTVLGNTSESAWPLAKILHQHIANQK